MKQRRKVLMAALVTVLCTELTCHPSVMVLCCDGARRVEMMEWRRMEGNTGGYKRNSGRSTHHCIDSYKCIDLIKGERAYHLNPPP
eukprot:scaffold17112_cov103-Skeletonema_dohrnii-CCMP3373.AAC.2